MSAFEYIVRNGREIGAKIMIFAMALALFSFIVPVLFQVRFEGVAGFDKIYFFTAVRIFSWFALLIMLFFFGFAIFLRGGRKNEE